MKKTIHHFLLVLSSVLASAAHAAFINEVPPPKPPQEKQVTNEAVGTSNIDAAAMSAKPAKPQGQRGKFEATGTPPAEIFRPKGKGSAIPLRDVMPAITPREIRVDFGDVSKVQTVSWSGGQPWDQVLRQIAFQLDNTTVTLDWNRNLVIFARSAPVAAPPASGAAGGPAVVSAPPQPRWEIRAADLTLRQSLIRWAKDAGWQVSWEVRYDYPVQLEAVFVGTFEEAVEKYTDSLMGSEYPILGCLYEANRVVRILHYGDKKGCDK
ncbi:toxin co-regulated pilus biosynthesis Q family protein [Herbaspirillum seropedicae]|uniref:toxin co-regulated pilus biosynthesis Q family protein n=1 Tax=Herbaspirillum seropedicae TaxID=964 RepID=UPI00286560BC|nr:toxin co-regulated pilus biosynthesis Q family protein [Herbaspirillum seropedicae]MDR6398059.1 hypothetical protein [Herbaspirillum seropedicae]